MKKTFDLYLPISPIARDVAFPVSVRNSVQAAQIGQRRLPSGVREISQGIIEQKRLGAIRALFRSARRRRTDGAMANDLGRRD